VSGGAALGQAGAGRGERDRGLRGYRIRVVGLLTLRLPARPHHVPPFRRRFAATCRLPRHPGWTLRTRVGRALSPTVRVSPPHCRLSPPLLRPRRRASATMATPCEGLSSTCRCLTAERRSMRRFHPATSAASGPLATREGAVSSTACDRSSAPRTLASSPSRGYDLRLVPTTYPSSLGSSTSRSFLSMLRSSRRTLRPFSCLRCCGSSSTRAGMAASVLDWS
jgi:hypothetical protein